MDKSAVILAGGFSKWLGSDKGLIMLAGKPLVDYVLNAVDDVVDEKIVVVSSKAQAKKFSEALKSDAKIIVDKSEIQSPLTGASAGFSETCGRYALLLPCDIPLVLKETLTLLLEICINKSAVVPRWPDGHIEPLHAAYHIKLALDAAEKTLNAGKLDMHSMIEKLNGIRYISTLVLQQFDPELKTFFNVNTLVDLKRAEQFLKSREIIERQRRKSL
ncbi:MAG: molybdenum cofactor guanylyltransferase [Candidatus Bathyarchaeia archaeon]